MSKKKEYKKDKEAIQFKIITLGNSGVGKSSILKRYVYKNFVEDTITTIGISYSFKEIILKDGTKVSLKLIDTAGQEKYRALSKTYFKHVNGAFFIFSLNDENTFNNLVDWIKQFEENNEGSNFVCKYLIGNKSDLENVVDENLIENFKKENKFDDYVSTSAKDNINIDKIFENMSLILYDNYNKNGEMGQISVKLKNFKNKKRCINCNKIQ